MKKDVTYIEAGRFEELIARSGLPTEQKAGWVLVGPHGAKGPRLIVPKTKRVGRVDAVGLTGAGLVELDEYDRHGAVTHRLDMSGAEEAILSAFASLLGELRGAAPSPKRERAPRAARGTEPAQVAAPAANANKAERLARIAARAQTIAREEEATELEAERLDGVPATDDIAVLD